MSFLLDNIRHQMAVMCSMGQQPTKLRCDIDSFDALMDEIIPMTPILVPVPDTPSGPPKIFGLEIQFSNTPDFEVIQ